MFNSTNLSAQKRAMMQKTANRFLKTRWAAGVSELLAAKEAALVEKTTTLADALDEGHSPLPADDGADRAEEIRAGVEAIISDEFPSWYVETYDVGNDRLGALADSDREDVEERMQGWLAAYRDKDVDALRTSSDYELIRGHVERSFGVSLETWARIVHWREPQHERAIRRLLVGRLDAVEDALDAMAEAAQGGEDA